MQIIRSASEQFSLLGTWSFLVGCGAFTYDSILRKPISVPYFTGCMLFNVGCVFHLLSFKKDNPT